MPEVLDLTFRLITGQDIKLQVRDDGKISEVKGLIAGHCDISPRDMKLIFKGQLLVDDRTIGSYDVANGSTIHIIGNSPGPSNNTQTNQGNTSMPSMLFGTAMNAFMREFMGTPEGPASGSHGPFPEGTFGNAPGQANNGSSFGDFINASGGPEVLLRQGLQFAQQMTAGNPDLGQAASRLFSGMMGGMMNPGHAQNAGPNNTSATSSEPARDSNRTKAPSKMNQQDIETIVLAKDCLDVCCDAISGLDSDEGIGGSQASKELRSQCEDGIKLSCRNNDIYLDDPKSFKELLPWNLLHTLEMDLGVKEYHNVNQQDMTDFMQRYRDAQTRVHDLLRELETISEPSEPVDMDKVSRITSICALQTAIHGQMALITTILGNKISHAKDSSLDTSSRPGFTKAKPHERASGPTVSSNVRQGLNTASILPSTTQSSSLLASLGIVNPPQAPTISIPAYSSDDILVDSTWLRKQLTQYRNSTGFKSRMNDLVRDTKKLSNIYCTGILPK